MNTQELEKQIRLKKSFLCVGLDVDKEKMPIHLQDHPDGLYLFCKEIIDATHDLCVAYKPNTAFFEAYGLEGWQALTQVSNYLKEHYPDHLSIADAKRGDIGNTSTRYAKAFFEQMNFDSVTVAPYMGRDSVEPFLAFEDKITILLALTSNPGGFDFQTLPAGDQKLFEEVITKTQTYKNSERLMYVVGATKTDYLQSIRQLAPEAFLLVPGVGAQGGSLADVVQHGINDQVGLLVNSSRGIIYASTGTDFAQAARHQAEELQKQMATYL